MRVNIGSPVVRTDGRAYGHVITKFSRMGRLPHFLSYGAPSTRALRARVELRYNRLKKKDLSWRLKEHSVVATLISSGIPFHIIAILLKK